MDMQVALKISAGVTGQQAVDQLRTSMDRLDGAVGKVRTAFLALGGAALVGGFVNSMKGVIDAADHMNDLRQKTGIAVEELDALSFAAQLNGTSLEAVSGAIAKLSKNMGEAAGGNREAAATMAQFGISAADLRAGSVTTTEALAKIADKISQMPDGMMKAAAAQRVFGKSAAEIVPLLNAGGGAIREAGDELDRLGGRMTGEMAANADEFNDNMTRLARSSKGLGISLANTLLPGLNQIAEAFINMQGSGGDLQPLFNVIDLAVRGLAAGVLELIGGFRQLVVTVSTAYDQLKALSTLDMTAFNAAGANWTKRMGEIAGQTQDAAAALVKGAAIFGGTETVNRAGKSDQPGAGGGGFNFDFGAGKETEFDKLKKSLEEQLAKTGELTKMEELLRTLQNERYSDVTKAQRQTLINIAKQIDGEQTLQKIQELARKEAGAIELLRLEGQQVNMTAHEYEMLVAARQHELEVAEATKKMNADDAQRYREVADALFKMKQGIKEVNYEQSRTFEAGAKRAFNEYIDQITNVSRATEQLFSNAFKGMEDTLVEFVMTGKLNFKSLANSIISDMTRMFIQQQIMKPLIGGLGSIFKSSANFGGYTDLSFDGGGYTGNAARLGGIDGKGGFMAIMHPQETVVDHTKGQSLGGNNTSVIVNVNVESGSEQVTSNQGAGNLGSVIANAVKAELINQKRPGGLLAA